MRLRSCVGPVSPRMGNPCSPRPLASTASLIGLVFLLLLAATWPATGIAQYMYLDSDGDGIHTAADQLNPSGPTTVDVWLDTDSRRDGTSVACPYPGPSSPINIFSYGFILRAVDGTVTWTGFVNRFPNAAGSFGERMSDTEYTNGYFSLSDDVVGLVRLASLSITTTSGTPSIEIVTAGPTLPTPLNWLTAFGSDCLSPTFDNTWFLGRDWHDVDGLAFGTPIPSHAPVLAQPAAMTVPVGAIVGQVLSATDADRQPVTFSKAAGPSFFHVETLDAGQGTASGEASLWPIYSDAGSATASIDVTDGIYTDRRSFEITVTSMPNRPPALARSGPIEIVAGTVGRFALLAGDPDGEPVHFELVSGPHWAQVTTLAPGRGTGAGSLDLAPDLCGVGTATAVVSATDGSMIDQRALELRVLAPRTPPATAVLPWPSGAAGPGVALGDLDEDGRVDLVTGYLPNSAVTVSIGLGDGTFGPASSYGIGAEPTAVALGDLNGDGHLDAAAVTEFPETKLAILLGAGNGTLSHHGDYATGALPQAVYLRDVNADGNLDAIAANSGSDFVSLYLGDGAGSFGPRRDITTAPGPVHVAVADFDMDGRLDLATANIGSRSATLLFGRGDGTFGRRTDIANVATFFVVAVDFNSDGVPDLGVRSTGAGIQLLIGVGDGTFLPGASTPISLSVGDAAAADWNGDGNVDLVVADDYNGLYVLYGAGDGTFPNRDSLGPSGYWLALGDVNADGFPDAAVGVDGGSGGIVLNQSSPVGAVQARAFLEHPERTLPAAASASKLCVRLEPLDESYASTDVDLASVTLYSEGTGSVSRIPASPGKVAVVSDTDRNGIDELPVCFATDDLARLFDGVTGRRVVPARVEGALYSRKRFCSRLDLTVVGVGKALSVSVAPNPLNPSGVVTLTTPRNGFLRVRVFDLHGRLVRTIADVPLAPAGAHEFRFDARDRSGATIASGIYFLRVETPDGISRTRIAVLK